MAVHRFCYSGLATCPLYVGPLFGKFIPKWFGLRVSYSDEYFFFFAMDTHVQIHIHIFAVSILMLWYKVRLQPTAEPRYSRPCGDRTHDFQTEATLPDASRPARSIHATDTVPKTQFQQRSRINRSVFFHRGTILQWRHPSWEFAKLSHQDRLHRHQLFFPHWLSATSVK